MKWLIFGLWFVFGMLIGAKLVQHPTVVKIDFPDEFSDEDIEEISKRIKEAVGYEARED